MRKNIYKIGYNAHQIWLFLTLVMMRRTGRVTDDDDRLVSFAKLMARTFNTVDVMENWNDDEYIREMVDMEKALLEKAVDAVAMPMEEKRRRAGARSEGEDTRHRAAA